MRPARIPLLFLLLGALLIVPVSLARAAAAPLIDQIDTTLEFPNQLTFRAQVSAETELREVVLEYGVEQRTCGVVTARAYPELSSSRTVDVSWTWDMRRSGSLPPGARIWYRWRATDSSGAVQTSPEQRITWLDDQHAWRSLRHEPLTLHWYAGNEAFARELLDSATASLDRLSRETGVTADQPIDIYIYQGFEDLRDAVLYEPGWTGGLAYAEHHLTIIGVAPDQLEWGKRVTAHELTHVLVGNRAFACVGNIPTWLTEGIAVYGEGGPEPSMTRQLDDAIRDDTILSVRSLSGAFAEDSSQADLSYAQSYSLVAYLITTYGREKLLQVFDRLTTGEPIDSVLRAVYGFGVDGLEDRWRASIGAQPRGNAGIEPTPTALPSPIPTLQPISEVPAAITLVVPTTLSTSPTALPSAEPATPTAAPIEGKPAAGPSVWLLAGLCGLIITVLFATLALVVVRLRGRTTPKD